MNWTRAQVKANARLMVKKNWIMCILVSLVVGLTTGRMNWEYQVDLESGFDTVFGWGEYYYYAGDGALLVRLWNLLLGAGWYLLRTIPLLLAGAFFAVALAVLLGNVLEVGAARFYLHNIHSRGELGDLLFGFRYQYGNVVAVMFRRMLYIFLWSLLFVIPGIVKAYEYRMVPYLLADNPELTAHEALERSREMMRGEKWNAWVLDLSFFLWDILSAVTMGIAGLVWVGPYEDAAGAELYTALKAKDGMGWQV
ncbi:MAG: DUF975 family protein [Lachnospiraceae bacterium]|nr:DUF975 family protein [Lachnospiraceae bacterium]